jgi:hypothetical protein
MTALIARVTSVAGTAAIQNADPKGVPCTPESDVIAPMKPLRMPCTGGMRRSQCRPRRR